MTINSLAGCVFLGGLKRQTWHHLSVIYVHEYKICTICDMYNKEATVFRLEDGCKTCTQQSHCEIALSLFRYTVIEAVLISEFHPVPSLNS